MIKTKWFLTAVITVTAFAIVSGWLWFQLSAPSVARDFKECAEQAEAASVAQRATFLTDCGARFAGRRKPGGGYIYYDFMQDRSFDIVGPNPTPGERKQIDREYMKYLDSARLDVLSAELAQQQNHIPVADLGDIQPEIGQPIALTYRKVPSAQSAANRSKDPPPPCPEGALACSWEKATSAMRNAFASASKPE
jgi:hypothetical protein